MSEPHTGYEMSQDDFESLLREPRGRLLVADLLADWYGYQVIGEEGKARVESSIGLEIDPAIVHGWI